MEQLDCRREVAIQCYSHRSGAKAGRPLGSYKPGGSCSTSKICPISLLPAVYAELQCSFVSTPSTLSCIDDPGENSTFWLTVDSADPSQPRAARGLASDGLAVAACTTHLQCQFPMQRVACRLMDLGYVVGWRSLISCLSQRGVVKPQPTPLSSEADRLGGRDLSPTYANAPS
jgi:hypothetical protein